MSSRSNGVTGHAMPANAPSADEQQRERWKVIEQDYHRLRGIERERDELRVKLARSEAQVREHEETERQLVNQASHAAGVEFSTLTGAVDWLLNSRLDAHRMLLERLETERAPSNGSADPNVDVVVSQRAIRDRKRLQLLAIGGVCDAVDEESFEHITKCIAAVRTALEDEAAADVARACMELARAVANDEIRQENLRALNRVGPAR